jgi:hypothetical protein
MRAAKLNDRLLPRPRIRQPGMSAREAEFRGQTSHKILSGKENAQAGNEAPGSEEIP